ncbi:hypothetical protein SS1G_03995 [Sclerotinia sclerotiorum 1980 UF-70]|uniref:Uncharacterized protein n=1 Tax=Sclerotinia sclerotiorum (strain ATCC 18683 / 1980 / Ss-1) TaxID=665079 RepID=A7EFA4_SCLS1|nr:hypothetical protein SS1G_03995 [Sclerotinia sclerotiorum 1980 UF-70]EDO01520.1 hypothetical protein SS1G_03995 [Sclerotinia sclerotiorum 1980 UF-70]
MTARTLAMQTQAGRSKRGSSEPPDRYRIHDVVYAFIKLMERKMPNSGYAKKYGDTRMQNGSLVIWICGVQVWLRRVLGTNDAGWKPEGEVFTAYAAVLQYWEWMCGWVFSYLESCVRKWDETRAAGMQKTGQNPVP